MDRIRVGMVGYGYWGPNLARSIHDLPAANLAAIADLKQDQLRRAKSKYAQVALTPEYKEIIKMKLEAVGIFTPPKRPF